MMNQLKLIAKVISSPRSAFGELPSKRWYVLAWLAPLYFGVARAFRPPGYARRIEALGSNWKLLGLVLIVGLIMIPFWAWVLRQVLKLFKKRLSVRKLMNIYGYALVPRLIVAGFAYVLFIFWPLQIPEEDVLTTQILIMLIFGGIGMVYSMFLYIYGIVISESEVV
jgi:hypothetical protein